MYGLLREAISGRRTKNKGSTCRYFTKDGEAVDGLFDKADNNNGFFGLTLIITLFGVSIFCDLLHQTF